MCGGLNFYLRRRLLLLEPPGFIPPTYLQPYVGELFVRRDRIWKEWREGKQQFLLFTNPTRPLERPADLPQPCYEVGRGDDSLILTNRPGFGQ